MRPAPFQYQEAGTVDEACAALAARPGQVAILAGGQSLVPELNSRRRTPAMVLGIGRIAELTTVTVEGDRLRIGATVIQRALQRSGAARAVPVLLEALDHVGHVPTRNRGTVGGSIAFADPTAELPVVLLALGGTVRARSARGTRTVPAVDLFAGPFRTVLHPDELLIAVDIPLPAAGSRWAFEQRDFRRHAKVSVVAGSDPGGGLVVAVSGVGDRPLVLPDSASAYQRGGCAAVATAAADLVTPIADRYGSVDYRRRLTRLAVTAAVERVSGDPTTTIPTREDAA
ncbi:FAD binding domain-containing protein [Pseudonocardia kujensis]|uniref:FAD binding domain-containing protein n=1 Tax=Pseudonocardia kujensis TaxID=1128675 RepID=UPI001E492EB8|nr:FAD binding domain-containing protein [Pseudonocardia kujensis]MCE0763285.1 FAD binding domain-containing protein [Pseudonocardia kujensis]